MDQKYDETGTVTKAGTRNMTRLGLEPRTRTRTGTMTKNETRTSNRKKNKKKVLTMFLKN